MTDVNIILFDKFETLDVFGPAEIFGKSDGYSVKYFSLTGGLTESAQGVRILTDKIPDGGLVGICLVPGGEGTRGLVRDDIFIKVLRELSETSIYTLCVCTGSALVAWTGLLNGKAATSNKLAFDWVSSIGKDVKWIRKARWVQDGKYYTSSGVSAGMDMVLGFISDFSGMEEAERIAKIIEYVWNKNKDDDPFA